MQFFIRGFGNAKKNTTFIYDCFLSINALFILLELYKSGLYDSVLFYENNSFNYIIGFVSIVLSILVIIYIITRLKNNFFPFWVLGLYALLLINNVILLGFDSFIVVNYPRYVVPEKLFFLLFSLVGIVLFLIVLVYRIFAVINQGKKNDKAMD